MNKNILVIGGAGYIGSSCVNSLVNSDYNVTVLDNLSTGQIEKVNQKAKTIHGDILDIITLENVFKNNSFSTIIHFAAKKAVGESEENPELYFQNNVVGTLNILSMMSKYNVPKIIFSSTAAVYKPKDEENAVYTEDSEVEPINVYGRTKLMCELIIKDFTRLGKIKEYTIFRYFNVAGDTGLNYIEKNAQNVFPLLTNAILNGTEFTIFGEDYSTPDGSGVRDYIHLSDLVNAHVLAIENNTSGIYNLGTKNGYSVKELIKAFEDMTSKKMNIKISERRKGDPATVIADSSKSNANLNWKSEHSLDDMVTSTLKAYGYVNDKLLQ
jgi:UDP-glucose 4-epimerase